MELCTSESKKCVALFTKTKSFCKLKTMEVYEEHVFNAAIHPYSRFWSSRNGKSCPIPYLQPYQHLYAGTLQLISSGTLSKKQQLIQTNCVSESCPIRNISRIFFYFDNGNIIHFTGFMFFSYQSIDELRLLNF